MNHNNQQPGSADLLRFERHVLENQGRGGLIGITPDYALSLIKRVKDADAIAASRRAAGVLDAALMKIRHMVYTQQPSDALLNEIFTIADNAVNADPEASLPDVAMPEQVRAVLARAEKALDDAHSYVNDGGGPVDEIEDTSSAIALILQSAAQPAEGSAELILQARSPEGDPWHDAVLDECMKIETAYKADDPAGTVRALINWHYEEASGVSEGVKRLADNYMRLTCATPAAEGATQAGDARQQAFEAAQASGKAAYLNWTDHPYRFGQPLPHWDDLTADQRAAWVSEARIDGDKQGAQGADHE